MSSGDDSLRLVVTPDDQRAIVVIVVAIGVIWSIMVIAARLTWRLHQKSVVGLDDTVALAGTILSCVQGGLTLGAVHFGFGKKASIITEHEIEQAGKYLYAASIVYLLSILSSRASVPLLIARLTRETLQLYLTYGLTAIVFLWGFASTFAISFSCGLPIPWIGEADSTCTNLFAAWIGIEVVGLLIEAANLVLVVFLLKDLRMLFKFKAAVFGSFTLRILLIIPIVARLVYIHQIRTTSPYPFFDNVKLAIASQFVMHYSLWAASFPCMRAFLRAFDTGLGATHSVPTYKGSNYGSNGRKQSGYALESGARSPGNRLSFPLSPISNKARSKMTLPDLNLSSRLSRNSLRSPISPVSPTGGNRNHGRISEDETSQSSKRAIINKTVEYEVRYEDVLPGQAM